MRFQNDEEIDLGFGFFDIYIKNLRLTTLDCDALLLMQLLMEFHVPASIV